MRRADPRQKRIVVLKIVKSRHGSSRTGKTEGTGNTEKRRNEARTEKNEMYS